MNKFLLTSVCTVALLISTSTAHADQQGDEMAAMKKQIEFLHVFLISLECLCQNYEGCLLFIY